MLLLPPRVQDAYASGRAKVARCAPMVFVQIGPESTFILAGKDDVPSMVVQLSFGSKNTAPEFFAHASPTGVELEQAIASVEDEVVGVDPRIRNSRRVSQPSHWEGPRRARGCRPPPLY